MDNKTHSSSSSSSSSSLDYLFGPKHSSSSSSVFGSIFSPTVGIGRDSAGRILGNQSVNYPQIQSHNGSSRGMIGIDSSSMYPNEAAEPCYFSSSIYYGGQQNYSPRTTNNSESHHAFKKYEKDEDLNENHSHSASRGNWWQGSLYY